jgi:hypothetical protein
LSRRQHSSRVGPGPEQQAARVGVAVGLVQGARARQCPQPRLLVDVQNIH